MFLLAGYIYLNIRKKQIRRAKDTLTDWMPAPRKALVNRKTPVAMASHVLNAVDELLAMDKSLRKEGKQPLIIADDGGASKEKEYLESARLVLSGILIRARKLQKEEFDAACKKFEEEEQKTDVDYEPTDTGKKHMKKKKKLSKKD